jgi:thiamine transporter ThiT
MNDKGIAFMPVLIMGIIGLFTIGFRNGIAVGLIVGIIVGLLVSILNTLVKILNILNSKSQFKDEN